jgi:Rrf2 family protein
MQIALGRKGDYSVRAVLVLARQYGEGRRKSREIARVMDIPERYLPQVMAPLVRGGLVFASAGPNGGYELARAPRELTLLDVIEAAEGPIAEEHCLLAGGPCDWEPVCPVHDSWANAYAVLSKALRRTTFAQLAENDRLLEQGRFQWPNDFAHPARVARHGRREPPLPPNAETKSKAKRTPSTHASNRGSHVGRIR